MVLEQAASVELDVSALMDVDESLLTGEADLISEAAGDAMFSGSFCVNGRAGYEAQKVGTESSANKLTAGARTFTREHTPLQRQVDLFIRALLAIVASFGMLLAVATLVRDDVPPLGAVRSASVVMGIAPSSMFLMIVVAYALGAQLDTIQSLGDDAQLDESGLRSVLGSYAHSILASNPTDDDCRSLRRRGALISRRGCLFPCAKVERLGL